MKNLTTVQNHERSDARVSEGREMAASPIGINETSGYVILSGSEGSAARSSSECVSQD
jgi:hypothetical protein